jgi:hypothetical protein
VVDLRVNAKESDTAQGIQKGSKRFQGAPGRLESLCSLILLKASSTQKVPIHWVAQNGEIRLQKSAIKMIFVGIFV